MQSLKSGLIDFCFLSAEQKTSKLFSWLLDTVMESKENENKVTLLESQLKEVKVIM